jgi:4-hydroxy-3-methylbut-2-enyl diphosphate reductase
VVATPLRVEGWAVRRGAGGCRILRTGIGRRRAVRAAGRIGHIPGDAVAVSGFAGALSAELSPGDVVVATEVRGPDETITCPAAELVASMLEREGLRVHAGPLVSAPGIIRGDRRSRLAETGAIAVDMESAWLARGCAGPRDRRYPR